MTTATIERTYTLTEVRSKLAHELAVLHRQRQHWRHIGLPDEVYFRNVTDILIELGHSAFNRPGRERW